MLHAVFPTILVLDRPSRQASAEVVEGSEVGARKKKLSDCIPGKGLADGGEMNESCIGLREQRLLDKSKAFGVEQKSFLPSQEGHHHDAAGSSTGTLSSSVAEEHRLEQAAIELCDQVLQEIDEDSLFFASNPPRPVAMFHQEGASRN
jgi:hypothetical protein